MFNLCFSGLLASACEKLQAKAVIEPVCAGSVYHYSGLGEVKMAEPPGRKRLQSDSALIKTI